MKLTNKQKRSIKRQVDLDLGVKAPNTRIFVSKKIYTRKRKHKLNTDKDG
tara:strand:- start:3 stop:152 length:150 start_codon:yes stop_codon:yes gene_type:complete